MIIDSYDINSEPIVKLENFYGEKQHLVKKCMVIFSKVIYEYMLEKFPCRQIAEVRACNGNIPVWTLPYEEETIAFYLTPIGSALAAGNDCRSQSFNRSIRLYHVRFLRQFG